MVKVKALKHVPHAAYKYVAPKRAVEAESLLVATTQGDGGAAPLRAATTANSIGAAADRLPRGGVEKREG